MSVGLTFGLCGVAFCLGAAVVWLLLREDYDQGQWAERQRWRNFIFETFRMYPRSWVPFADRLAFYSLQVSKAGWGAAADLERLNFKAEILPKPGTPNVKGLWTGTQATTAELVERLNAHRNQSL